MASNVPEVEFVLNSNGVTVFCPQLETPRFVPFDQKGRCPTCKSDNVEIDYIIQDDGVTLFCSRMKDKKFIAFDQKLEIKDKSFFRVRTRTRPYNIPLNPLLFYPINNSIELKKEVALTPPLPPPVEEMPVTPNDQ